MWPPFCRRELVSEMEEASASYEAETLSLRGEVAEASRVRQKAREFFDEVVANVQPQAAICNSVGAIESVLENHEPCEYV